MLIRPSDASRKSLGVGLVGAGRIGSNHAEIIARRIPGAYLAAVADPLPGAAERLAQELGAPQAATDVMAVLTAGAVDAVVIAAPARMHTDLVVAAAEAGKHVFCEKPMALSLVDAERAIAAASAAGVVLQVGFNRRFAPGFAAAREAVDRGVVGVPHLLRSLTRDPGPFTTDHSRLARGTVFLETLVHDFDTLCFLNPGAAPVRVHAFADALVRPDARGAGHLDTAVVTVTFDNGAMGTAEASFSALYGYDVRAEVFGSAGMATAGSIRTSDMQLYTAAGLSATTARKDTELMRSSYIAEMTAFVDAVRAGAPPVVGGRDARTALAVALAALRSVDTDGVVSLTDLPEPAGAAV